MLCFSLCLFCPVMSSRSPAAPCTPTVSSHIPTYICLLTPPMKFSTSTDAIRRISLHQSSIHPSIQAIHPPRLTSVEDGATDAAFASAAPPLKGHTCSLLSAAVFRWNGQWHQNKILQKTELSSWTVALDSVFICCRSSLLLPSLYFAWQHWVTRACAVTADRSVTWPAADFEAAGRMKRTWLWLFERLSLGFFCLFGGFFCVW